MDARYLLPDLDYDVESVDLDTLQNVLRLRVKSRKAENQCPCCGQLTQRIHSHYQRKLQDMPCSGRGVEITLCVRRFFCDNPRCERRIFTERLPDLVSPHARRTERVVKLMQYMGLLVGGSMSVRLLHHFPLLTSRCTVLRDVRKVGLPKHATPRVLGVDDWARRRGHTYGTVLVDLGVKVEKV